MPLTVNTYDLLADGCPPARDNARLGDGWECGIAQESLCLYPIPGEHRYELCPARICPADARRIHRAPERRCIVGDICSAPRDDALSHLLQDEHRCLTRDPRNLSVKIHVRHHITDDEHRRPGKQCHTIYHGVNSHLIFHLFCSER